MVSTSAFNQLAAAIIKHQEAVVGPLAWSEAGKVSGLKVNDHTIVINGDGKKVLEGLVNQYATLFGRASIEVCREAVSNLISSLDKKDVPEVLT